MSNLGMPSDETVIDVEVVAETVVAIATGRHCCSLGSGRVPGQRIDEAHHWGLMNLYSSVCRSRSRYLCRCHVKGVWDY